MNNSELLHTFTIDLPQQEVQDLVRRKLNAANQTALARGEKGFRAPEFMPPQYLLRKFGEDFLSGIMQELVNKHVSHRIDSEKWDVAGVTITGKWTMADRPFRYLYEVTIERYPQFEVKGLDTLQLRTPARTIVDDTHIDAALEVLRRGQSQWKEVDRLSQRGDRVTINFSSILADGSAFPGGTADNVGIELGAGGMLPDFENHLTGVKATDKLDFSVTFPTDYTTPVLRGQTAFFNVLVLSVAEFDVLPLDDDFAKKVGVDGTITDLREKTRVHLQMQHDEQDQRDADSDLLRQLAMANICILPQSLVRQQLLGLQAEVAFQRGVAIDQVQNDDGILEQAQYRVHLAVVVRQLTLQEKIEIVPDQDLTAQILEWLKARAAQNRKADDRFVHGATCTWFGSIHETKSLPGPHGGIPCCPFCSGVLFEASETEWWKGVDTYEKDGHPGYRAMWQWQREQKKCFPLRNGIDLLVAAYQSTLDAATSP